MKNVHDVLKLIVLNFLGKIVQLSHWNNDIIDQLSLHVSVHLTNSVFPRYVACKVVITASYPTPIFHITETLCIII